MHIMSDQHVQNFSVCGSDDYQNLCHHLQSHPLYLEDFDYPILDHKIALYPTEQRDQSRLCLIDHQKNLQLSNRFCDLATILKPGTLLIFNNTAVFPARLYVTLAEEKFELFLLTAPSLAIDTPCLVRPAKKLKKLQISTATFQLTSTLKITLHCRQTSSQEHSFSLSWQATSSDEIYQYLQIHGHTPLPPYIRRAAKQADRQRYQTVYAHAPQQSCAAPTAGLHFSRSLIKSLTEHAIELVPITLHVGAGTFTPVRTSHIMQHRMHHEMYEISRNSLERIFNAKDRKDAIIAVGTTTMRALESLAILCQRDRGQAFHFTDTMQSSDLFICIENTQDRYTPWLADGMITNFHAPRSTLLMMVSALMGYHTIRHLYHHALLDDTIRLLSYGDASLMSWNKII